MGSLHICSDDETSTQSVYSCRLCCSKFPSICILHNHILQCSGEGTYIYDNRFRTVYSLSFDHFHKGYSQTHPIQSGDELEKDGFSNTESDKIIKEIHDILKAYSVVYKRLCSYIHLNNTSSESEETKDDGSSTIKLDKEMVITEEPTRRKRGRPKKATLQRNKCIPELSEKNEGNPSEENILTNIRSRKRFLRNKKRIIKDVSNENLYKRKVDGEDLSKVSVKEEGVDQSADIGDSTPTLLTIDEHPSDEDASEVKNRHDVPETDEKSTQKTDIKTEDKDIECSKLNLKSVKGVNKSIKAAVVLNSSIKDENPRRRCGRKKLDLETCEVCGKRVKRSKLKIHAISHSDNRPYQCEKCPKTYKYPEHLSMHMKSHEDVLPFYCEVCGQGFVDANRLKRHAVMHTSSRPFQCPTCSAGFVTRYKLERHMFAHTGVKKMQCDLCGMRFAHKENLSQHIAGIHKKERRFPCPDCDKSFFTNYQLKCHSMKHAGVRPYKCSHCTSDFIERKELRRHMRKQHRLSLDGHSLPHGSGSAAEAEIGSHVQGQITQDTEINSGSNQGQQLMEAMCVDRPGHTGVTDLGPVLNSNLQGNMVNEGNQSISFKPLVDQSRLDMLAGTHLSSANIEFDREDRGTSLMMRDGQLICGDEDRKERQMAGSHFRTTPTSQCISGYQEGKQMYAANGGRPMIESLAVVGETTHTLAQDRYQYMVIPASEQNSGERFTIL